jgi:hypothetical protein
VTPAGAAVWIDALGGRRFLLCGAMCIVNAILVIMHRIGEGSYTNIILGTIGAFIIGNSFENHGQGGQQFQVPPSEQGHGPPPQRQWDQH